MSEQVEEKDFAQHEREEERIQKLRQTSSSTEYQRGKLPASLAAK